MSFSVLKKGVDKLRTIANPKANSSSSDVSGVSTPNGTQRNSSDIEFAKQKKSAERSRSKADKRKQEHQARKKFEDFINDAPEETIALFKPLSMNMSKAWTHEQRFDLRKFNLECKICPTQLVLR